MPIKRITPLSNDDAFFTQVMANVEKSIINKLCFIGESCLAIGRSTNTYIDKTGNLRGSIGYVVVSNGNVITKVTESGDKEGAVKGRAFIEELVGSCGSGMYLIVVAGMNYATHVASRGYDVLDSAELEAERLMKQLGFHKR